MGFLDPLQVSVFRFAKKILQKSFWRKEKVSTRITLMPKVFCNQIRLSVKQTNIFFAQSINFYKA